MRKRQDILEDGKRRKIPMTAMDSVQKVIARSRPGFVTDTAQARTAKQKAYDEYDEQIGREYLRGNRPLRDDSTCPDCGGTGDCKTCEGSGVLSDDDDDEDDDTLTEAVASMSTHTESGSADADLARNPPRPPAGSYPYSAAKEGTSCSLDGRRGRLRRSSDNPDWLVCVPDAPIAGDTATAKRDHQARMEKLYADRDRELQDAWRGAK